MPKYQSYRRSLQQMQWLADFNQLPKRQQQWLMITGSLTAALKQRCNQFSVQPIFEGWVTDNGDTEIQVHTQQYWLREVILLGDQQPWIFARTIIPIDTFNQYKQQIQQLGNQPIGEWLFQQPIQRSKLMWGKTTTEFARRSVLTLSQHPFFISELFLEDFWLKA
ncbi:hypothetical protein QV09_11530 [Gallibacterium salpingitidis]|uniref:Probable chorismate pyruvate-lyase n=1 Tax=Gallibacterium salpingitidis TaxID=505341 RepID=A0AB36DZT2_9PAST|nr:chorismate lyase [Gallibacterium salpingitidis]OBX07059.1 hypothetical protein QV09_11530 [Gallibacterium salpingitidis]WKS99154.1 chorismate lyase [Gallibacterium salpingitidis]